MAFFKDYYDILQIPTTASPAQIKFAFKKQAFLWHPDKNPNMDAKERMQDINEAYLILKDSEARSLYDKEYERFKSFKKIVIVGEEKHQDASDYQIFDETLKKWMTNARQQASDLVALTFKEIKIGVKAAGNEMVKQFVVFSIIGMIFTFIILMSKGCN